MTTPRPRGRPSKTADDKSRRINIILSPNVLALIDAQPGNRSQTIARLIAEKFG
jgi:AT hook motif